MSHKSAAPSILIGSESGRVVVEVELRLISGWSWRITDVGWLGNGCEKVVVACRLVVSASGLGSGCVVVELALRLPRRRADVRPWTLPLRGERVEEIVAI